MSFTFVRTASFRGFQSSRTSYFFTFVISNFYLGSPLWGFLPNETLQKVLFQFIHVDGLSEFILFQVWKDGSSFREQLFCEIWTFPVRLELPSCICYDRSGKLQYQIPFFDLVWLNFLIISTGNPFLIQLGMIHGSHSFLIQECKLRQAALNPLVLRDFWFQKDPQRSNFYLYWKHRFITVYQRVWSYAGWSSGRGS